VSNRKVYFFLNYAFRHAYTACLHMIVLMDNWTYMSLKRLMSTSFSSGHISGSSVIKKQTKKSVCLLVMRSAKKLY
jgi:hypothetical protein